MTHNRHVNDRERIFSLLHGLRKMMQVQSCDNMVEFVLHALAQEGCLDLDRAAYVIDNPDFDCTKGIAGFCKREAYNPATDIWQEADKFSDHMRHASFNQRVRGVSDTSFKRAGRNGQEAADALAQKVGMKHYHYCMCDAKHDNHGILLFEHSKEHNTCEQEQEAVENAAHLLGMCPVF